MKISFNIILSTLLLCSFVIVDLHAQVYYFKKYTTTDGLVQGTVKAIYQDSKGRMWFGTAEGVSIYDGTEFSNYGIAEGLNRPVITSFYEISPGIMLVGTLGDGVVVFSDPPFSKTTLLTKITDKKFISGNYISQIIPDDMGNIWFVTDESITIWKMNNNKVREVLYLDSLGNIGTDEIYQLVFYDRDYFYAATESGLIKKSDSGFEQIKYNNQIINGPIFKLFKDSNGIIWFTSHHDLFYIKNGIVYNSVNIHQCFKEAIYCFGEDQNHNLYFGTIDGIIQLGDNTVSLLNKENGLDSKDIISLFSDSENNLWIGSLSGVSKLTGSNFKFVRHENFKGHFTNIIRDENKLFITSSEGLFEIENYKLIKSELGNGIRANVINHLFKDSDGNFWFSTENGVFKKSGNKVKHFTENDGLSHNFIYQISVDKNNTAWIATQRGLVYIRGNHIYNFKDKLEKSWFYSDDLARQFLISQSIRRVIVDDKNSVWVGPWDGGLFHIKENSVIRYTSKDGLMDLNIRGVQIDANKNLWVSTRYGGAFKYDGQSFINYSTKNGLKSNWVFSVETDDNQNTWFCTANGLTKLDGSNSITYDASDGIISAEIISSTKFDDKLWFISNSQIFSTEPEEQNQSFNPPGIFFKQVKLIDGELPAVVSVPLINPMDLNSIINQPLSTSEKIILEYYQSSLVFEFAGIGFRDEKKIRYDFILEGFDKVWTTNTQRNYLTYTHLPPGKYSFKVFALNKEGLKSSSPAVFNFEILLPFWQRWWFIALSILFFVLVISLANYFIYQYKIRQALKLEKLRTKISTDLHDEIGTSLSSIAIFAGLIKRDSGSIKKSDLLERIENTSRDLIDKMSDIVWAINPGNDKFEDALLKLKDYTVKILESRSIDVNFNIETANQEFPLPMDVRRNLLMIFKEIVTNAAKYSNASVVKITLRFDDKPGKRIFLSIEDDGIGFDLEKHRHGFGIGNIKRRAEEIKAKLEISTSPERGTRFTIEIPLE